MGRRRSADCRHGPDTGGCPAPRRRAALAGLAAHSRVVAAARDPKGGAQFRQHVFVSEGFHAGEAFGRGSTRMPNAY